MLDVMILITSLWSNFLVIGFAVLFVALLLTALVAIVQTKYKTLGLVLMIPNTILFSTSVLALKMGATLGIINLVLVLL